MRPTTPPRPWTDEDARGARRRYEARGRRLLRERVETEERRLLKAEAKLDEITARDDLDADQIADRKARVAAAIERARQRRQQHADALARAAAHEVRR